MTDLTGIPLVAHLDHLFSQHNRKYIYSLPARKVVRNFPDIDFSVKLFGKPAATPLGPAAGPHTQMTQNIVMSYLAGSRIIELKTIQVLDDLDIQRPCIDMRNIGYNIEWSQELSLHNSYQEYLNAWIILHILRDQDFLDAGRESTFYNFIFDMSVGYDLEGIQSDKVSAWLQKTTDAGEDIRSQLDSLPARFAHLKTTPVPNKISDSVTLSAFHGCPGKDIEEIVKYLIREHDLNVVVKMNPTLLGYERVKKILLDDSGYHSIELDPAAFEADLTLAEAVSIMQRLTKYAQLHNRSVGAKFTNTLVVKNNESIFKGPVRYLSGPPLYVIAMHSMQAFREQIGHAIPISFSGGINKNNFAEAVSCNLIPVTTCTDLLKKGGYSRLSAYLDGLHKTMIDAQAPTIEQFILSKAGLDDIKSTVGKAAEINTTEIIRTFSSSKDYHYDSNKAVPAKIKSRLAIFDCLSCDICIPVCPNGANFYYPSEPGEYPAIHCEIDQKGKIQILNESTLKITKPVQIGNIAEFCNDCGNCETFCPETGAPYLDKLHFFIYESSFRNQTERDGIHFKSESEILLRDQSINYRLIRNPAGDELVWSSEKFTLKYTPDETLPTVVWRHPDQKPIPVDGTVFQMMYLLSEWRKKYPGQFPITRPE